MAPPAGSLWWSFRDEERAALLPWDGDPYETTHWQHRQGASRPSRPVPASTPSIRCQSVRLSAGSESGGQAGQQIGTHIYHRGKLVETHVSDNRRGGRATDPNDYPAELSLPTP